MRVDKGNRLPPEGLLDYDPFIDGPRDNSHIVDDLLGAHVLSNAKKHILSHGTMVFHNGSHVGTTLDEDDGKAWRELDDVVMKFFKDVPVM